MHRKCTSWHETTSITHTPSSPVLGAGLGNTGALLLSTRTTSVACPPANVPDVSVLICTKTNVWTSTPAKHTHTHYWNNSKYKSDWRVKWSVNILGTLDNITRHLKFVPLVLFPAHERHPSNIAILWRWIGQKSLCCKQSVWQVPYRL